MLDRLCPTVQEVVRPLPIHFYGDLSVETALDSVRNVIIKQVVEPASTAVELHIQAANGEGAGGSIEGSVAIGILP